MSRPEVPSPCIKACRLNPATGLCDGCLRTIGEITRWGDAGRAERSRILTAVVERRAKYEGGTDLVRDSEQR